MARKGLINNPKTLNNEQRNQRTHGQSFISNNSKDKLSCNFLTPKVIIEKLSPIKIMPSVSKRQRIHNRISNYKSGTNEKQQLQYDSCLSHSLNGKSIKDAVIESLNISVQEDKLSTQYFQSLLNKETNRLNKLCEKWMKIKTAPGIPKDGQYQINQAIGEGEMLVTCEDLQGFWDMTYMEVKNCDSRFDKLEKLCSQDWKEEELPIAVSKKKTIVRKKVVSNKTSSIRAFLAEKKKKIAEKIGNDGDTNKLQSNINQVVNNRSKNDRSHSPKRKTKSMIIGPSENKTTHMQRDKRLSLIQKKQLSERSKKIDSPLTLMKISQMSKTPRVQLYNFKSYVKSNQTPGKSILKKSTISTKVQYPEVKNEVNFDDHIILNEVSIDEKTQTKKDLDVVISKANSSDADSFGKVSVNVKKKLAFEDNSFEKPIFNMEQNEVKESPTNKKIYKLPYICIQPVIPLQESNENLIIPRRSTRRQNIDYEYTQTINQISPLNTNISMLFEETTNDIDLSVSEKEIQKNVSVTGKEKIDEYNNSIRVLRNRTITSMDTPINKRRSRKKSINIQDVKDKENKTPLSRRRTMNAFQDNVDDNERMDTGSYDDITYFEKDRRRRSTRCIKFSVKECSVCNPNKPVLPVTPYVRRSKAHSNNKKESNTYTEDCVSLKVQEKSLE
ncbi:PREDICTED: disks large-associated protein 5-like [Eufriesea mexicana]|uniref:disks large-associated protein 5-like n=1 Tax=Eufriesea mexicana TaxID=516756 RepID=UPI00083C12BC|nr:PREDICTED: disks large-associated protein 5-like [Eufriesea mexicana]